MGIAKRRLFGSFTCGAVISLVLAPCLWAQNRDIDSFPGSGAKPKNVIARVEFVDTPITTIFKMISDLTGWSIVMSPELSQQPPKVNLWVKNLSADEVLEKVGSAAELVIQREGNVVKISRFEEYARANGLEKKVIQLKSASARDVAAMLKPFAAKDDQARIVADESGNRVALLVPKPLMESLLKLIGEIDVPAQEESIRVIRLKHLEASVITPMLEQFLTQRGTAMQPLRGRNDLSATSLPSAPGSDYVLRFMVEPKINALLLRGQPKHVETAVKLIEDLDISPEIQPVSYQMKFTNARDVYDTLSAIINADRQSGRDQNSLIPPRMKIACSEQNNQIVVEGSKEDHARIAAIIDAIDRPMPPGCGSIRVYRLENATSTGVVKVLQDLIEAKEKQAHTAKRSGDLAGNQQGVHRAGPTPSPAEPAPAAPAAPSGGEAGSSAGTTPMADLMPTRITDAPEINAVIVRAATAEQEELAKLIQDLDKPRSQVMLEVTMVAVRSTSDFEFGLELSGALIANGGGLNTIGFNNFGIGKIAANGQIRISEPPPLGLNYALFASDDYSLVLNALKTVGDTRITSSPKILVEDNAQAQISTVNQQPFSLTSQGQSSTVTSFGGYVDAGTTLTVIPHLSERDWLRLEYQINLSSFSKGTDPTLPPPRLQNGVTGLVRIPDSYTVVLGGLVSTQKDHSTTGIPWVSDIPIVGELLKSHSDQDVNTTLFIFIRPVVMRDPAFKDLLYMSQADLKAAKLDLKDYPVNGPKMLTPSATTQPKGAEE